MKHGRAKSDRQSSAVAKPRKTQAATIPITSDLLANIARQLDISRAIAVVCRTSLPSLGLKDHGDTTAALRLIADQLQRDIDELNRVRRRSSKLRAGRTSTDRVRHPKATNVVAVEVPRETLDDIRFHLSLISQEMRDCCMALLGQSKTLGAAVIDRMANVVIASIDWQVARLNAVSETRTKRRRVIAFVGKAA